LQKEAACGLQRRKRYVFLRHQCAAFRHRQSGAKPWCARPL